MMYPPPWMNTITGSGSSLGFSGATTLRVRQSSLIGLVPADTDQGVATLLGRAVGEAVAVPHPRPGLHGSRRAEA